MLSEKVFKDGLKDIQASFDGFKLTGRKTKIWYRIVKKETEDYEWEQMIHNCIVNCYRVPTLADILDVNDYYKRERK